MKDGKPVDEDGPGYSWRVLSTESLDAAKLLI